MTSKLRNQRTGITLELTPAEARPLWRVTGSAGETREWPLDQLTGTVLPAAALREWAAGTRSLAWLAAQAVGALAVREEVEQ